MKYTTTHLEESIESIYNSIGVRDPDHPIFDTASRLGIELNYFRKLPFAMQGVITLDPRLTPEKQKEVFAHELAHVLYHVGIQLFMPDLFRMKQEWQAKNFALHFCIPTFMLHKINFPKLRSEATSLIAETFCVTNEFAEERLIHYENQVKNLHLLESLNIVYEGEMNHARTHC